MKKFLLIGRLSGLLVRPAVLLALVAQFIALLAVVSYYHGRKTSDGCLYCHADHKRMAAAGYPQYYVTREQAERETKMPGVTCVDCHLGDGRAHDGDAAHLGMPRPIVLDNDLNAVPRKGRIDTLLPSGGNRMYALFPKKDEGGRAVPDPDVFTVLWHDRDPVTLGYDPGIAKKTCGRKGCHPQEVEQFGATVMGGNVRQRGSRHWLDTHGPNNCGPSFADLPPDTGAAAGFSGKNSAVIKGDLSCPSSSENYTDRQRYCNVCHAGCLDCHYNPGVKQGAHGFTRRIPSETCTGGGRGTGMCHSGSQERRRGDSYLGAEFSQPAGMATDAHYKKGMECMDCHITGGKGMGDMQRAVDCSGCHYSITRALGESVHRGLRCQACHVSRLGGYEMTVWGIGHVAGRESPFKKYSLYYGIMEPPVLIKDREGLYTPYKVWPNMATNILRPEKKREGIEFRWPGGETKDAYAFLGTYGLPGAGLALAWLQLESVGHPLGRSRGCRSCHASAAQRSHAGWEYLGHAGAEPFTGMQEITADKDGLRVTGIRAATKPALIGDARPVDFAAWMYLGDIWSTKGDFSIPRSDPKKYAAYEAAEGAFKKRAAAAEARLKGLDKKGARYAGLAGRLGKARELADHDPAAGIAEMDKAGF